MTRRRYRCIERHLDRQELGGIEAGYWERDRHFHRAALRRTAGGRHRKVGAAAGRDLEGDRWMEGVESVQDIGSAYS